MRPLIWLGILAGLSWVLSSFAFRTVRRWCRIRPALRPLLLVAGAVALTLGGFAVPRIFILRPPWSESPSGLFLILARGLVVGPVLLVSAATLAATALPVRREPAGPEGP